MTVCVLAFAGLSPQLFSVHPSVANAKLEFTDAARELGSFGQTLEAFLYIGVQEPGDYPDYVLSLGPRGGVVCSRA